MTRGESGSTLIELVLIVALLFSMLFAIIDFALIEASDNAGSNAAREGARQAIIGFDCADLHTGCASPSVTLQAITAKVTSRLGGLVIGTPAVTVSCWDGTTASTPKTCDSATIVPGVDLVEVDVTWTRMATSAYATATRHTDRAKMTIEGSGQATRSTSCQVIATTVTPAQAQIASGSSGPLAVDVSLTAQTNGLCQPLYLSFATGSSPDQVSPVAMAVSGTTFSYTISRTAGYSWVPGTYNLNLSETANYPLKPAPAPVLTVFAPGSCSVTGASVSPSAVVLSGATSPSTLAQSLTVSVTTTTGCSAVNAVFSPDATTDRSVAMTGSGSNWALSIPATLYNWTVGAKQFGFTNAATTPATVLQTPSSVILQVALRCAITVTLSPTSISTTGGNASSAVTVTASPTTGSDCTGLNVTYTYAHNASSTAPMTAVGGAYQYTIPQATAWKKGSWPMTFSANNTSSVSSSPNPVQVQVS